MTESTTKQSVAIDDLHEAQVNAEQQLTGVGEQIHACETRLRGLVNTDLTDEQRDEAREHIRTEHRALIEQQRTMQEWITRLKQTIENFELRISQPATELKRATSALAAIDERLTALSEQTRAVQGDREIALLHLATARAAVEAVTIALPERPLYASPARTIMGIGAPTEYRDAHDRPVTSKGAPIRLES